MTKVTVVDGVPRKAYYAIRIGSLLVIVAYMIFLIVRSAREYSNPLTASGSVLRQHYPLPMVFMCDSPTSYTLVDIADRLHDSLPPDLASLVPPACRFYNSSLERSNGTHGPVNPRQCPMTVYSFPTGDYYASLGVDEINCYLFNFDGSQYVNRRNDYMQLLIGVTDHDATIQGINVYFLNSTVNTEKGELVVPESSTLVPYDLFTQMYLSTEVEVPLFGNYFTAVTSPKAEEPPYLNASYWKYTVNAVSLQFSKTIQGLLAIANATLPEVTNYVVISINVQDFYLGVNTKYSGFGITGVFSAVGGAWSLLAIPLGILFVEENHVLLQFAFRKYVRCCNPAPDVEKASSEMFDIHSVQESHSGETTGGTGQHKNVDYVRM